MIRNFSVEFSLMSKATKIEEIIQQRCIRKLVHFTRIINLKSIIEFGILPRLELEKKKIKVEFNDHQRLDTWPETSSISITEKNSYLFMKKAGYEVLDDVVKKSTKAIIKGKHVKQFNTKIKQNILKKEVPNRLKSLGHQARWDKAAGTAAKENWQVRSNKKSAQNSTRRNKKLYSFYTDII